MTKLLVDAVKAAAWYQDRVFRNFDCKRIQVGEIWGFVGAKAKNAKPEKKIAGEQGDVRLWVATDADTKLVPSWLVGGASAHRTLTDCVGEHDRNSRVLAVKARLGAAQ